VFDILGVELGDFAAVQLLNAFLDFRFQLIAPDLPN